MDGFRIDAKSLELERLRNLLFLLPCGREDGRRSDELGERGTRDGNGTPFDRALPCGGQGNSTSALQGWLATQDSIALDFKS